MKQAEDFADMDDVNWLRSGVSMLDEDDAPAGPAAAEADAAEDSLGKDLPDVDSMAFMYSADDSRDAPTHKMDHGLLGDAMASSGMGGVGESSGAGIGESSGMGGGADMSIDTVPHHHGAGHGKAYGKDRDEGKAHQMDMLYGDTMADKGMTDDSLMNQFASTNRYASYDRDRAAAKAAMPGPAYHPHGAGSGKAYGSGKHVGMDSDAFGSFEVDKS